MCMTDLMFRGWTTAVLREALCVNGWPLHPMIPSTVSADILWISAMFVMESEIVLMLPMSWIVVSYNICFFQDWL